MVAQQSRAKKGKAGNGRKSMSQSIARNNNTATQDDENISINLILAILSTGIMAFTSDRVAECEIPLAFACVCAAAVCDDRLRLYDSERFVTGIRRVCACCRRGVAAWRVAGSG